MTDQEVMVSRHIAKTSAEKTVIVGWDNPMQTFFLQVWEPEITKDEPTYSRGDLPRAVPTVEDLNTAMDDAGLSGLTDDLILKLRRDREGSPPRTDLQEKVEKLFG